MVSAVGGKVEGAEDVARAAVGIEGFFVKGVRVVNLGGAVTKGP